MILVSKVVMCLRSDVPFDPASHNQILSVFEGWQELGDMIDSWRMKKTQQPHETCQTPPDNR